MTDLFSNGRIVDFILALMALEALALAIFRYRTGRGLVFAAFLWNLLAGAALLVAVRGALVGAVWPWIALPLLAALIAHTIDLSLRFRR